MLSAQTVATLRNFAKAGLIAADDAAAIFASIEAAATGAPAVLLSAKEIARRYGCCVKTVHRLADDGRLPRVYLRPGMVKSLRFRESDVNAVMAGATVES